MPQYRSRIMYVWHVYARFRSICSNWLSECFHWLHSFWFSLAVCLQDYPKTFRWMFLTYKDNRVAVEIRKNLAESGSIVPEFSTTKFDCCLRFVTFKSNLVAEIHRHRDRHCHHRRYTTNINNTKQHAWLLMPSSHRRHRQDKTPLSCLVGGVNWVRDSRGQFSIYTGDRTVLSSLVCGANAFVN